MSFYTCLLGTPTENFHLPFEEYRKKMNQKYGEDESKIIWNSTTFKYHDHALMLAIAFASLVVAVLSFNHNNNPTLEFGGSGGLFFL